ncbi:MAG TPA: DUF503 domain-containing protein [bacterium]|nr:DUF503 domain-containing protein [bacterium]
MVIGSLQVELYLPGCGSLKEKRMILKGLKERVRARLNVSAAEIDYTDKWQRSVMGFASVANETGRAKEVLENAVKMIEREDRVEILDQLIEML